MHFRKLGRATASIRHDGAARVPHAACTFAVLKAVFALLAACSSAAAPPITAPARAPGPKLVVLMVIDQWPEWSFEQKRTAFTHGFARLLAEGQWRVGRYPTAATLTGPDHAMLGTGEPPARSGIVADEWWHRDTGEVLEATHDSDGSITSKWLRVPGLGDAVAAAHSDAKAVDVALKPRAAVLPLGHAGLSIWYDFKNTKWAAFHPPGWLDMYNREHPISAHLHEVWKPLDESRVIALSGVPDAQPGEVGSEGFGATFPHDPQSTKQPAKALLAMPVGNDLVLDLATHVLDAEELGHHRASDLLVVGLSTHDYVGHGWGHESWEMWDLELRLDQRIGDFLDALDRKVGAGNWAMIVTADHGGAPMPERNQGGRLQNEKLEEIANNAATAVLGEGRWIAKIDYPNIWLTSAMLKQPKDELASATKRVINALSSIPGVERAGKVVDLAGRCEQRTGGDRALCLAFDPERSGELFFTPARFWLHEEAEDPEATGHGSLQDYDQLVPYIELAPGHARHAPQAAPAGDEQDMLGVAARIATWLGVPAPTSLPR
jgi:hypothetical protein